jgi:LacI family transcriptional regulator
VLAAAAKLDYRPNVSAQAVARGASATVALLVSDIADPYFSSIAAGVIQSAEEAGLIVTMGVTERDADRELALVRTLRGQRHKVLILAGSRQSGEDADDALKAELQGYERTGGRVVLISQHNLPFDTVMLDNHGGGFALAERLLDLGYRRFGAIAGASDLITSSDRMSGFTEALAARGITIPDDAIARASFTRDGGFEAAHKLLERGIDDLELVFAVNDVMAVGAMSAFRDAGVDLPGQLAIAGYDDISTVRDITPPLSTVRVPLLDIGRKAMELALGPHDDDNEGVFVVSSEVVIRESTPPRG